MSVIRYVKALTADNLRFPFIVNTTHATNWLINNFETNPLIFKSNVIELQSRREKEWKCIFLPFELWKGIRCVVEGHGKPVG